MQVGCLDCVDIRSRPTIAYCMHPQLDEIIREFHSATERLDALVQAVPEAKWQTRPDPDRWSVAECVEHLNITGRKYLPILDQALKDALQLSGTAPRRYRRDPIGWMLWRTMGPPVRQRVKTTAEFVPVGGKSADELAAEFKQLQHEQITRTEAFDGLQLQKVRVKSPFNERVTYNAFSCLSILPRHQHRHLWQAEQVAVKLQDFRPRVQS